ncbi:MAG: DNA polymerase III subunit gamma/tau [Candidatus Moraniibacteriota bacterium]
MISSTLYRKYRPAKFSDIIGQKHIIRTLSNAIANDRIGQAYLFTGPRGTGKTTTARLLAKTVNCLSPVRKNKDSFLEPCLKCANCLQTKNDNSPDIIEIDAASNTGVDNIRDLRENAKLSPLHSRYKIYIIDEVHMLSQGAFNALLKILEEPPKHIIFILATTEIHKVPETIISRCQRFDFSKFDVSEIIEKLTSVAKKEKIDIAKEALELIAINAEGGMRDAESILEQIITLEKDSITAEKVAEILGVTDNQTVEKLTELVFKKQTGPAILLINQIYKDGNNPEFLAKSWLDYLRKIMLLSIDEKMDKKMFARMTKEQKEKILDFTRENSLDFVLQCIRQVSEIIPKIKESFISQLPLEALIVELTASSEKMNPVEKISASPTPPAPKNSETPAQEEKKESPIENSPPLDSAVKKEEIPAPSVKSEIPHAESSESKIDINILEKNWKNIIDELCKENCSLAMMLSNSKPVLAEDSASIKIVIRHAFQKDLINKTENRLTIAEISNKITELRFKVEAVTEEESGIKLKKILPDTNQDLIDNICKNDNGSQDSLLSDAMNLMGGKIVTNE